MTDSCEFEEGDFVCVTGTLVEVQCSELGMSVAIAIEAVSQDVVLLPPCVSFSDTPKTVAFAEEVYLTNICRQEDRVSVRGKFFFEDWNERPYVVIEIDSLDQITLLKRAYTRSTFIRVLPDAVGIDARFHDQYAVITALSENEEEPPTKLAWDAVRYEPKTVSAIVRTGPNDRHNVVLMYGDFARVDTVSEESEVIKLTAQWYPSFDTMVDQLQQSLKVVAL